MVGQRANEELWTRTGTFVNKPQRGWLHAEEKVKAGGICYGVRVSFIWPPMVGQMKIGWFDCAV